MPHVTNQGEGPWGSGPKGPFGGSGPANRSDQGPRILKTFCRRGPGTVFLQQLLPGGYFSGIASRYILIAALGDLGIVRIPSASSSEELASLCCVSASVCAPVQPGLNYHQCPSTRPCCLAEGRLRGFHHLHRHDALMNDPAARRGAAIHARTWPEESLMPDRPTKYRRPWVSPCLVAESSPRTASGN